jgi:hypothetical protein
MPKASEAVRLDELERADPRDVKRLAAWLGVGRRPLSFRDFCFAVHLACIERGPFGR